MENQDLQDCKEYQENKDHLDQRDPKDTEVLLVYKAFLGQLVLLVKGDCQEKMERMENKFIELLNAGKSAGHANFDPDDDGAIRYIPLGRRFNNYKRFSNLITQQY